MTIKLAVIGGRPEDGTILPRQEKEVWKEVKRVLSEDIVAISKLFPAVEFLIPLYSKFDIEFLREIKKYDRPVTFYVPSEDWGLSRLPKHQTTLIKSIDANRIIIPNSTERLRQMLSDASIIYCMKNTKDINYFEDLIESKNTLYFPEHKMRFKTESEAEAYFSESLVENTDLTASEKNILIESFFS